MFRNGKGQTEVKTIFLTILIFILATTIVISGVLPYVTEQTVEASISKLESKGYVVLSAGEYALIAKEATASAAVTNAELAVIAAQTAAAKVDLFNCAEVFLFPNVTNITVTLTAGNTNVWSDWAEVTDSTAVTLSSKFATAAGYINDMYIYDHSAVDKVYCVELSYGVAHTTLGRMMWHTSYKDTVQIKSRRVPAGETIYYRMMCSGANGATAKVGFRYFFE
jgi:hypothetical protein